MEEELQQESKINNKPEFRNASPRFVVKDFNKAVGFYSKLGFQVIYRDEGFTILGRDAVEIQMNCDKDQVVAKSRSICYITVSGIDTIYKQISSNIPIDPCTGRRYSLQSQSYGVKQFALYDPFANLLFFAEPIG